MMRTAFAKSLFSWNFVMMLHYKWCNMSYSCFLYSRYLYYSLSITWTLYSKELLLNSFTWKISIDFFTTKEGRFKHVHLCSFDLKVIVDRYLCSFDLKVIVDRYLCSFDLKVIVDGYVPFDYLTTSREAITTLFKKIFLTALFQP